MRPCRGVSEDFLGNGVLSNSPCLPPRIDKMAIEGIRFNNYNVEAQCLCRYRVRYFTFLPPEALHGSMRTGAGLLRSTRHEWMALILAIAILLLTRDFFSISMTLLLTY
jgi:hypothetical protein